jgi:hypothetical protein
MSQPVETFKDVFNRLHGRTLALLDDLYDAGIVFKDPLHEIQGLPALRRYFERLYEGVRHCSFTFEDEVVGEHRAMLTWTMHLEHAGLCRGRRLHLPGASHIRFADKVQYHRDYFDVGALLYERVPLLGPLVCVIKSRV